MRTTATDRAPTPRALPIEVAAAGFYALQVIFGVVLWIAIGTSDLVRSWHELVPGRPQVTDAFFTPDVVLLVSSALAAWALWRGRSWAMVPVLFTLGGMIYPTAYLVGWVAQTDGTGEVALSIMLIASALNGGAALLVWRARRRA